MGTRGETETDLDFRVLGVLDEVAVERDAVLRCQCDISVMRAEHGVWFVEVFVIPPEIELKFGENRGEMMRCGLIRTRTNGHTFAYVEVGGRIDEHTLPIPYVLRQNPSSIACCLWTWGNCGYALGTMCISCPWRSLIDWDGCEEVVVCITTM
jgi:hypothetical protein